MGPSHTFHKSERLSRNTLIDAVFNKKGKSIHAGPLLFVYLQAEDNSTFPAQVLISVSKRKFKKAHDRNLLKRLIREAYRLNKHIIYKQLEESNKQFALAIIYLDKQIVSFQEIELHLKKAIDEFVKRIS